MKRFNNKMVLLIGFMVLSLFLFTQPIRAYKDFYKNETIYLDQDNYYKIYFIRMLNEEDVNWSFRTYDNSFKVKVGRGGTILSINKFSDSGIFQNRLGDGFYDFWFMNIDSVSGYIEIKIWTEKETKTTIPTGLMPILICVIISVITTTILVSKKIKKLNQ